MTHRTRVVQTSSGQVGICSCGFTTPPQADARIAINDHEVAALTKGVKVTHLEKVK